MLCENGYAVLGFDLQCSDISCYKTIIGDVNDYKLLKHTILNHSPDYIIHLAAKCDLNGRTINYYKTNFVGVKNLIEICNSIPSIKRIIITSSQLVCRVGYIPKRFDEYCPNTLYGESKVQTEEIIRNFKGCKKEWVILRPTTVWGPGMSEHHQSFLKCLEKGTYYHPKNKSLLKTYGFIDNVIYQYNIFLFCDISLINKKTFYIGDYLPLNIIEYANNLSKYLKIKPPKSLHIFIFRIVAKIGDCMNFLGIKLPLTTFRLNNLLTEYVFDLSDTKEICGELPFDFDNACKLTVDWYINNK